MKIKKSNLPLKHLYPHTFLKNSPPLPNIALVKDIRNKSII